MISKISMKSWRCMGRSLAKAALRASSLSARIISRTARMRLDSKNMCSVRHRPMPSAPKSRAVRASSGVSALALTFIRRRPSAHDIRVAKSPDSAGLMVGTSPRITCPVEPSMVRISPFFSVMPAELSVPAAWSMRMPPAPETQGLPMPRATTAACEVMPPRAVRMPSAACMPWMSSGLVSRRTRITLRPSALARSASSASKTISPEAAPGEAGSPVAITSRLAPGSRVG